MQTREWRRYLSQSDTSSTSPTGYGGGMFLTGNGDYDSLSKMLDFRKMKIYGNIADKAGQSLYVAITKIVEWCKKGTAGEYVKRNYSEGISNINEPKAIPVNSSTFITYFVSTSTSLIISQTATTRTFRNYPLDSTLLSSILIKANGGFNFHMQSSGPQIGKCLVSAFIGVNHIISNLNMKNVVSYENINKIDFMVVGSICIVDIQFENITMVVSTAFGGTIGAIIQSSYKLEISNCQFTTCKAQDIIGGAIYVTTFLDEAYITFSYTQIIGCQVLSSREFYARMTLMDNQSQKIHANFNNAKQLQVKTEEFMQKFQQ
ncbi:MAG: hypothetical protein EZS28_010789 [Streblomastix strix]|uniref:Uncharacterized protein n=1 Tax=Streblomastix strix TaxID=222440 RepID=A0A5J4WFC6_9EUKA|nr:MAG: hypothetical protein EZS28_010789 [Streblomastix strix]